MLGDQGIKLIKERFVPWAPCWGTTGYPNEDEFISRLMREKSKAQFDGTFLYVFTASGKPVKGGLTSFRGRGLEGVLQDFLRLPESERKPVVEDRGPFKFGYPVYTAEPPAGGVILDVYCRPLKRLSEGRFVPQLQQLDLSEFGGPKGVVGCMEYGEPQRDVLWLTSTEWKSLVPETPRKEDTFPVPAAIRNRIFLFYLSNSFGQFGSHWRPEHFRTGALNVVVEDVAPSALRLGLHGSVSLAFDLDKVVAAKTGWLHTGSGRQDLQLLPQGLQVTYEARLRGVIDYDAKQKVLTRFDLVALGDFRGKWLHFYKERPVALGFAFELDRRPLPPECRNRMPYALFASHHFIRPEVPYWATETASSGK